MTSYFLNASHSVSPPVSAVFAAASSGCPLAYRARVTSLARYNALEFLIHSTFVLVSDLIAELYCHKTDLMEFGRYRVQRTVCFECHTLTDSLWELFRHIICPSLFL